MMEFLNTNLFSVIVSAVGFFILIIFNLGFYRKEIKQNGKDINEVKKDIEKLDRKIERLSDHMMDLIKEVSRLNGKFERNERWHHKTMHHKSKRNS